MHGRGVGGVLPLLAVLLLGAAPPATRSPEKCGRVVIARAEAALARGAVGGFRIPTSCPHVAFPAPYAAVEPVPGLQVLRGPQGDLAFFVTPALCRPPVTGPTVRQQPRACPRTVETANVPKAPPGYRVVWSMVEEGRP